MFAVGKTATFLLDNKIEGSKIMVNCDSQAANRAINSIVIKNSTTLEATMALNTLGKSVDITLRWIPAHCVRSTCLREVLTMTELLGSNSPSHAASVTQRLGERI